MIEVARRHAGKYPVLELTDSESVDEALPLVFFYHGWEGCKEKVLTQGYEIARRGFRVVLPDAQYHGEREVNGPAKTHFMEFWQIIADSVSELPDIVNYYSRTVGIRDDFVGVSGLSMGGITTCAMMASYDWISAAVCLMGSPCPVEFARLLIATIPEAGNVPQEIVDAQLNALKPVDLSLAPERIAGRPFHFWHGTADPMVPYKPTRSFYDEVKNEDYAANVTFTTTEGAVHKVSYETTVEMAGKFAEYYENR